MYWRAQYEVSIHDRESVHSISVPTVPQFQVKGCFLLQFPLRGRHHRKIRSPIIEMGRRSTYVAVPHMSVIEIL